MDSNGNKYQAPLAASFTLGIMGSLIYFLASIMPGRMAVNAILLGRFVTGMFNYTKIDVTYSYSCYCDLIYSAPP